GIFRGRNFIVSAAGDPVFRAEERDHLNAGRMKQPFDGCSAKRVESRVVRDQPDVLAAQRRELFRLKNVEPRLHAPRAAPVFYRGLRRDAERESYTDGSSQFLDETATSLRQSISSGCSSPMIFWNASFGAAL